MGFGSSFVCCLAPYLVGYLVGTPYCVGVVSPSLILLQRLIITVTFTLMVVAIARWFDQFRRRGGWWIDGFLVWLGAVTVWSLLVRTLCAAVCFA